MKNQNIKQSKQCQAFTLVKDKDGIKICVGNYLVSPEKFKTFNDAEQFIGTKPYDLIFASILTLIELKKNENNQTQENAQSVAKLSSENK